MSNSDQEAAAAVAVVETDERPAAVANPTEQPAANKFIPPWWQIAGTSLGQAIFWVAVIAWLLPAISQGFMAPWTGIGAALAVPLFALAVWALGESVVAAIRDPFDPDAGAWIAGRLWHKVLDDVLMAVVLVAIAIASSAAVRHGGVPTWVFVGSVISFILAALAVYGVWETGKALFLDHQRARWQRLHETSATQ
jgi:hypothetical protein